MREDPDEEELDWEEPEAAPLPHSGLGLVSCVIAGCAGFGATAMVAYVTFLAAEEVEPDEAAATLLGLVVIAVIGMSMVGGALGLAALFRHDRRKLLGILGMALNGLIFAGLVGTILLGLAMHPAMR